MSRLVPVRARVLQFALVDHRRSRLKDSAGRVRTPWLMRAGGEGPECCGLNEVALVQCELTSGTSSATQYTRGCAKGAIGGR